MDIRNEKKIELNKNEEIKKDKAAHKNINIIITKLIAITISSILIAMNFTTVSFADDEDEIDNESIITSGTITSNNNINTKPIINSRRYVIYDRASGLPIYGKDENKQTAMASTTKIMTAIVILEKYTNLNEVVSIESKVAGTGGSRLGLKKDDKITINDLLYGLLMRSGNDAAVALAIHTSETKEEFAKLMNEKAKELGLKDTHFVTPHGLDDPEHYTTAYELAKITDYALKNSKFAEIVKTQYATITINGQPKELKNTNELLCSNIDGVYGVKTGFTNNAGRCLVTAVNRNGMDLIIVVLGADTRKDRAKDSLKLIEYAYNNYRMEDIESLAQEEYEMWKSINEKRIYVNKGRDPIETQTTETKIKKVATNKQINIEVNSITYLEAPIPQGTKIGEMIVKNGDDIIETINIVTARPVLRKNILDYFNMYSKVINL